MAEANKSDRTKFGLERRCDSKSIWSFYCKSFLSRITEDLKDNGTDIFDLQPSPHILFLYKKNCSHLRVRLLILAHSLTWTYKRTHGQVYTDVNGSVYEYVSPNKSLDKYTEFNLTANSYNCYYRKSNNSSPNRAFIKWVRTFQQWLCRFLSKQLSRQMHTDASTAQSWKTLLEWILF